MNTKYSINLRQFNNGESGKITFPTFEQCMLYGLHKLKCAVQKNNAIIQAILIEDAYGRKIVVNPPLDDKTYVRSMAETSVSFKLRVNEDHIEYLL
jgi:hypothetical protein